MLGSIKTMVYEFIDDMQEVRRVSFANAKWIITTELLLCEIYVKPKRVVKLDRVTFKSGIGYEVHLKSQDQSEICRYLKASGNNKGTPNGC